jgi:hypothetical protein
MAGHCKPYGCWPSFVNTGSSRVIWVLVSSRWYLRPLARSRLVALSKAQRAKTRSLSSTRRNRQPLGQNKLAAAALFPFPASLGIDVGITSERILGSQSCVLCSAAALTYPIKSPHATTVVIADVFIMRGSVILMGGIMPRIAGMRSPNTQDSN